MYSLAIAYLSYSNLFPSNNHFRYFRYRLAVLALYSKIDFLYLALVHTNQQNILRHHHALDARSTQSFRKGNLSDPPSTQNQTVTIHVDGKLEKWENGGIMEKIASFLHSIADFLLFEHFFGQVKRIFSVRRRRIFLLFSISTWASKFWSRISLPRSTESLNEKAEVDLFVESIL